MSFLTPAFLWGLLACGIPVLVYLWNTHREPRKIPWAMMHFLTEAQSSRRHAVRIHNWTLLLLRVLLIALLVFVFAQPLLEVRAGGLLGGLVRRSAVIVLDTSWSMSRRIEQRRSDANADAQGDAVRRGQDRQRTLLDDARRLAEEVVEQLGGNPIELRVLDEGWVTAADSRSGGTGAVRQAIREAPVTYRRADLTQVLKQLAELDPAAEPLTDVFLITDSQAISWSDRSAACNDALRRLSGRAQVHVLVPPSATAAVANSSVADLAAGSVCLADTQSPVRLKAKLRNSGPPRKLCLRLTVDGTPLADREELTLEVAEQERSFRHQFSAAGPHVIAAAIDEDGLAADDVRYLVVDVRRQIPVWCVENPSPKRPAEDPARPRGTPYLRAFLNPDSPRRTLGAQLFAPQTFAPDKLRDLVPGLEVVLVLADVSAPAGVLQKTEPLREALSRFVAAGGGAVVFLGPHTEPAQYNSWLYEQGRGLLPGELQAAYGKELADVKELEPSLQVVPAGLVSPTHPILAPFADDVTRVELTQRAWFSRAYGVALPTRSLSDRSATASEASTLVAFANGRPFLVERQYGAGSVLLFTSTCDYQWGTLPSSGLLALVDQALRYLVARQLPQRNCRVGQPLVCRWPATQQLGDVRLTRPDGKEIIDLAVTSTPDGRREVRYDRADRPGVYLLKTAGQPPQPFAVNVDPEESDLRWLSEADLRQTYPDFAFHWSSQPVTGSGGSTFSFPVEMRPALLWLLVLVAVAESLIAQRFGWRNATHKQADSR